MSKHPAQVMKETQKVAASLTVYRISDMTDKGRKRVCDWLCELADDLQGHPESFGKTFRARYYYYRAKKQHKETK